MMNCNCLWFTNEKGKRKLYHFTESGLPYVYLEGVVQHDCTNGDCGESEAAIPSFKGLMRLIAETLAQYKRRLLPNEIRFLRTFLGFSGVDFARYISVTPETVSRWEKGTVNMKESTEKFLRVLVLSKSGPFRNYNDLKRFAETTRKRPKQTKFAFVHSHWEEKKAA